jgi:hypothetical protein
MPPYATGEVGQYYTDNQQHDAHYDASQFDPYNTHHLHEPNDQEQPYQDEPNQGLPQGVSTDPLNHGSKEADEFNATPRQGGCVLRRSCFLMFTHPPVHIRVPRNVRTWRYQQSRPLWRQVRASLNFGSGSTPTSVSHNPGRRPAMFMSLLLLYSLYRIIPHSWGCPLPPIGKPHLLTLSQTWTYRSFQWARPPNVLVGGNNNTVCLSYMGQWCPD